MVLGCSALQWLLLCSAAQALVHGLLSGPYHSEMISNCLQLLEDPEPRVREAVGKLLGNLSDRMGAPAVWQAVAPAVLASVERNFVSAHLRTDWY